MSATARLVLLLGVDNDALIVAAQHLLPEGGVIDYWPENANGAYPKHPSKHGAIADRIIAGSAKVPALVVTHSAMILLRIRHRIADASLSIHSIAIYWIDGVNTERVHVNESGALKTQLPDPPLNETIAILNTVLKRRRRERV